MRCDLFVLRGRCGKRAVQVLTQPKNASTVGQSARHLNLDAAGVWLHARGAGSCARLLSVRMRSVVQQEELKWK